MDEVTPYGRGVFELRTSRLLIRPMRPGDAEVLAEYRNLPEVAALQLWELPYTVDDAQRMLSGQENLDGPTEGEWVQLAIERDAEVVGDLACNIRSGGGIAEIGYTLHPTHQGAGFATEAAAELVRHLIEERGIHRIVAELDPANTASMRVLERLGMTFSHRSERSTRMRGQWVDDLYYAMSDEQWRAWRARPRNAPAVVELVELDDDEAWQFGKLRTHHSQEAFVSPMANSYRDALFPEVIDGAAVVPWLRGVLADGERVGFVMLAEVTDHHPVPYLWRLLVDRMHQRRGVGERIMALVTDRLRAEGQAQLLTSWVEGPGSPRPFYERLGFRATGNIVDGETEGLLDL
jgi:RimJ/RimL family protein N-acetyltransferase